MEMWWCSVDEKFSHVFSVMACALIWPPYTVEGDVHSSWNTGESCHILYPRDFFPWPHWSGKIVYIRQRRQERSVRAVIEEEISTAFISSIPVTSLCGLILGVVKEDVFVTALSFLRSGIRIRMKRLKRKEGAYKFFKIIWGNFKNLGARWVMWSKFHTEDPQFWSGL